MFTMPRRQRSNKNKAVTTAVKQAVAAAVTSAMTAKPKRKRSRRNKPRKNNNSSVEPFRSVDQIQKTLMKVKIGSKQLSNYVSCRVDPFLMKSGASTGIPDGSNANFILIDSLVFDTITCLDAEGFIIQTLPMLPAMAGIRGLRTGANNISVNGTPVTTVEKYLYPISVPTAYTNGDYSPGANTNDPYDSSTARLVSVGYRLIYTGQSSLCSGTISVTPNSAAFANMAAVTSTNSPPGPGGTALQVQSATGATLTNVAVNTPVYGMDLSLSPTAYTKDSVVVRPEHGVMVLPKHRSSDFKAYPTTDEPYGLVLDGGFNTSAATLYNALCGSGPTGTSTRLSGCTWFDNDWSGAQIVVTGMAAGATFRWESVCCMEYMPRNNSGYMPLTIKTSKTSVADIDRAQNLTNAMPVAVPLQ